MPTAVALDTPTQVAATGTWWQITYPAHARGVVLQGTAAFFLRWGGVAEGDAIGTGYLGSPANGTISHWLPGSDAGRRTCPDAGDLYIAAAVGTLQVEVTS
jgi:hypothetical protein